MERAGRRRQEAEAHRANLDQIWADIFQTRRELEEQRQVEMKLGTEEASRAKEEAEKAPAEGS